ncbi:uncharacterized protein [Haliotis cracherodii]|uniref:uncharacterized protein n=1 Tax=Haliotis cracherodii TaxID=6455 RepID=UPI0039E81139
MVLYKNGISPKMFCCIQSIYKQVLALVKYNNSFSDMFSCSKGVRQGCVLSPILFALFINDLAIDIESSCAHGIQFHPDVVQLFLLLFADDVILIADTVYGLQKRINVLECYCKDYSLTVNIDKTKVVVFKNGSVLSKYEKWVYDGKLLECVTTYKYLGVLFFRNLSWSAHISNVVNQAKKVLFKLLKSLQLIKPTPMNIFFKIFDAKVVPVLLYGAEVWGLSLSFCEEIEVVHTLACKRISGVKSATSNHVVRGECGRYPLYIYAFKRCLNYWCKILKMPDSRYPRKSYNMLVQQAIAGKTNWASRVKLLLYAYGFGYVWENQHLVISIPFIDEFIQRLKCSYEQDWHFALTNSPKYSSYLCYKFRFSREFYLSAITINKFRVALARFRASSHSLHIETGRYFGIPRQRRLCMVCKTGYVESEYHFVLVCEKYYALRVTYIPQKYYVNPSIEQFYILMSSLHQSTIRSLACYIYHAFKLRNSFLQK